VHIPFHSLYRRQTGFSLPEIMIGMVIGLLGVIIIMQVTSVFEGQKRTTTGGDDAQNGGAIALNVLQRDISQAGYGINSTNLLTIPGTTRAFMTPRVTFTSFSAVMVNPAMNTASGNGINPDAGTDFFVVIYGNSNTTTEGAVIVNSTPQPYTIIGGTPNNGAVAGSGGHSFLNGDWVTVDDGNGSGGGVSNMHYMYQVSGVNAVTVPVSLPPSTLYGSTYNPPPPPAMTDTAAGPHPVLYNMGPLPSIQVYAVKNGTLSVCDFLQHDCTGNAAGIWLPLTGNVVSMRTQCINGSALRIALVARNSQPAGTAVTAGVPMWNPGGISKPVASLAIAASWSPAGVSWDHYRYKTFETIVPLRNTVWTGVQGC
jgi:type IV pilus assembly protein PilW